MGDRSAIQWTDATWNPIRGCSRVSEGCRNCYAERTAIRHIGGAYRGLVKSTGAGPRWTGKVELIKGALGLPLTWRDGRRIFVNSMSDLFHENVEDAWIDAIVAVMARAPQHIFQVLTKRPERMRDYLARKVFRIHGGAHDGQIMPFLPNVWWGVSVENQPTFDARVPLLGQTPAALRFLSMEPLLEEIDCGNAFDVAPDGSPYSPYRRIDWVIVGGESGPAARPCDLSWVRWIIAQCAAAGVSVFVKQLGAVPMMREEEWRRLVPTPMLSARNKDRVPAGFVPLLLNDHHGGLPAEWPDDLRIREFPAVAA
jgi:protein gp37